MDREPLSAGRVEAHTHIHHQLRRTVRPIQRLYERAPGEPARQHGVAGASRYDGARRLCALSLAAALRVGGRQGHRLVSDHHLPAELTYGRFTVGGKSELLRPGCPAEDIPCADLGHRYLL